VEQWGQIQENFFNSRLDAAPSTQCRALVLNAGCQALVPELRGSYSTLHRPCPVLFKRIRCMSRTPGVGNQADGRLGSSPALRRQRVGAASEAGPFGMRLRCPLSMLPLLFLFGSRRGPMNSAGEDGE